jgi:hypothetical protein
MINFKEYKENSLKIVSETVQTKTPKLYHIEDVIFNRGFVGAKQTIQVLDSLKERLSGTDLVSREDILSISENILKAKRLLSDISSLTLNRISTSETIKNHFESFVETKRNSLLDPNITNSFMKKVEQSLNAHILQAKRTDTKRKRQIEKTSVLRFYRNINKEIPLIFEFVSLVLDTKKEILNKMKTVKDEDSSMKIDEGFIDVYTKNDISIRLINNKVN